MIRFIVFGVIALSMCGLHNGQAIGECNSPDLTATDFQFGVINTDRITVTQSGVIAEYDMTNTVSVISTSNRPMTNMYIDARFDDTTNKLQIFATPLLLEYESREYETSIQLSIELGCTIATRELNFEQPLAEANNHAPIFGQEEYVFTVMLPLPRGFDLTFFQTVSARDLDIINNRVHFTSTDVKVVTVGSAEQVGADRKTFYATMVTSQQLLSVGAQLEFTITATDSGNPPLSAQARVIIRPDSEDVFVPVPKFASAFYRGTLDDQRQLVLEPLIITEDTYHEEITLDFSGGDSLLFSQSNAANRIDVQFVRQLTDEDLVDKNILMTTLVANRADVDRGSTVIIVDIPQATPEPQPLPVPSFEQIVYVGRLNVNLELLVPAVLITEATFVSEVEVTIAGADSALFKLETDGRSVSVLLARELDALDVQYRKQLMIELRSTRPDVTGIGSAVVLINIETTSANGRPKLQFERPLYVGRIDETDPTVLQVSPPTLSALAYSSDVEFSLSGEDANLFAITSDRNVLTVTLVRAPNDIELERTLLTLSIWARRDSDADVTSTELVVTWPRTTETNVIYFEESAYLGQIDLDRKLTVPTVALVANDWTNNVQLNVIGDNTGLLSYTQSDNSFDIILRRDITDDDLLDKSYLKFTLEASNSQTQKAIAVLIIEIAQSGVDPGELAPVFEKLLYIGELSETLQLTVENPIVRIDTYSEEIVFSLSEGDVDMFKIDNTANTLTFSLSRDLTSADVTDRMFLSCIIIASRPNVGDGVTAIVIRMPTTHSFSFELQIYVAILNEDGQLENNKPQLIDNPYTDVVFELIGPDSELFTLTYEQQQVTILRSRELSDTERQQPVFFMTIVATSIQANNRKESTEFIVTQKQPAIANQPQFEQRFYLGKIGINGKLWEFPAIRLNDASSSDGIGFELSEADSPLLTISENDGLVTLSLSRDLTTLELDEQPYLKSLLLATNAHGVSGSTVLIIEIEQPSMVAAPQFVQDVYRGLLDSNRQLSFEDIRVVPDTFTDDVTLSLYDDDYAMFVATKTQDDTINIALAEPLDEATIADRSYLTTVLNANRPNVGSRSALLLVSIDLTTPRPAIPQPQFTQPLFRGRIDANLELVSSDEVTLVASTFTDGLTFRLVGEDSALFTFQTDSHVLRLSLLAGLTDSDLLDKDFLTFRVDASHSETSTSSAGILIDIPAKVCPIDETPVFENRVYAIALTTSTTGLVGQVRALVPSNLDRSLRYDFKDISSDLDQLLVLDSSTGELTLRSTLTAGEYTVQVTATDASTSLQAIADVRLHISEVLSCPADGGQHVEHALLIKYLIENQEHADIMPGTNGDCAFEVVNSIPNDLVYVRNDPQTRMIAVIPMDREAEIFASMAVPQIQVTLKLICADDADAPNRMDSRANLQQSMQTNIAAGLQMRSLDPAASDGRWYTLTDTLPYEPRLTQLTIIIEDENDNAPQFETPLVDDILYAYPGPQIAEQIMPAHLVQVHATDRDAGLNAIVRYTLDTNAHFQVHGETGVVTPLRDAFASAAVDEITLTVTATDRDGDALGLSTRRTMRVRRLGADEIAVITVQERGLDDVLQMVVDRVYATMGVEMRVLHAARIPTEVVVAKSMSRQETSGQINVLRMFVYVVRNSVEIMQAFDVQDVMRDFDVNLYQLTTLTLGEHQTQLGSVSSNNEQLALVIACAVLGVLLLLSIVVTFLLWWYKIRPYEYKQMEDTESVFSNQQVIVNEMQSTAATEQPTGWRSQPLVEDSTVENPRSLFATSSGPLVKDDILSNLNNRSTESEKTTNDKTLFSINGSTTQETADDSLQSELSRALMARLNRKLENDSIPPSPPPPPPSASAGVRFNEMVERIDIEVEEEGPDSEAEEVAKHK